MAERQVGRLVNLSQVLPELLQHLSSGYRAANARYTDSRTGKRRQLSMVPLRCFQSTWPFITRQVGL